MRYFENNSEVWSVYQDIIEKNPVLSHGEERELVKQAQSGNKTARDRLVYSNMRYIIKMAGNINRRGLSKEDMIDEGIEGLLIAIDRFDLNKNVKLITYAKNWINKAMHDAVYDTADMIRIPQNKVREMPRMNVSSLDAHIRNSADNNAVRLEDLVSDNSSRSENDAELHDLKRAMSEAVGNLSEKESDIIRLHYGLDNGGYGLSYTKIGEAFGISKQAVRQKEECAFKRLKQMESVRQLDCYLAA